MFFGIPLPHCWYTISNCSRFKRIVSCEASSKFHRTKLPKRAFRAMLPTIFTEKASKMIVSCEASSKFHRTMLPKQNRSHAHDNAQSNSKSSKLAFRRSFVQSTHRILREGSSSKIKMCVSLQRRAIQNFQMHVSLQRRARKCMNPAHDVRGGPWHTKITILPQFQTSDQHGLTRGLRRRAQNLRFITVLDVR